MTSSRLMPPAQIFQRFAAPTEDWRTGSSKVVFKSIDYLWTAALRISGR
jgi:hypothetical protein